MAGLQSGPCSRRATLWIAPLLRTTMTTDCHFFLNGECTKGDGCAFRHCLAARAAFHAGTARPCSFFARGECSKPNCPHLHAAATHSATAATRNSVVRSWMDWVTQSVVVCGVVNHPQQSSYLSLVLGLSRQLGTHRTPEPRHLANRRSGLATFLLWEPAARERGAPSHMRTWRSQSAGMCPS